MPTPVVGPGTSESVRNAQLVLKGYGTPQIAYAATAADLSDRGDYPTLFRTPASDAFEGVVLASVLGDGLEVGGCCFVSSTSSTDAASAALSAPFFAASIDANPFEIDIAAGSGAVEAEALAATLLSQTCRVVVLATPPGLAGLVARSAAKAGIMGPASGWLWVLPTSITGALADVEATASVTQTAVVADGPADGPAGYSTIPAIDVAETLRGSIGTTLKPPSGPLYDAFLQRYQAQPTTKSTCGSTNVDATNDCPCNPTTDDGRHTLFQHDHDNDPDTPDRCVGFDYAGQVPSVEAFYAYDAVYAAAHAAARHDRGRSGGDERGSSRGRSSRRLSRL